MKKVLLFIWSISAISSCNHPEGKDYERFQGKNEKQSDQFQEGSRSDEKAVLQMEIENGVRYVWIEINGIRLRFIFDTGASNICISPAEATVLFRQGTLQKEDILDVEYFQDATGRISEGTRINLREVIIGGIVLNDVEATVVDNVNAPLLLGQSVLERFGSIEIDNEKSEIIFK
jgi:aspartyl protease family protein